MEDLFKVEADTLAVDRVRAVEVPDALVDTGAVMLSLPKRLIAELGLKSHRTRRVRTVGQRLIGNPEHGGEHMIDIY
ncbi:MAG: hypothetical protein HQ567_24550 [Candidatus Nealsonbacteria bacterium]|nr:hypothetical protein [Candidatus Nealsonbacteria bacterium]